VEITTERLDFTLDGGSGGENVGVVLRRKGRREIRGENRTVFRVIGRIVGGRKRIQEQPFFQVAPGGSGELRKTESDSAFRDPDDAAGGPDGLGGFGKVQTQIEDLIDYDRQRALQGQAGFADIEHFVELEHGTGGSGAQSGVGGDMGFVADAATTVRSGGSWSGQNGRHEIQK
jgi:hypothetical protein